MTNHLRAFLVKDIRSAQLLKPFTEEVPQMVKYSRIFTFLIKPARIGGGINRHRIDNRRILNTHQILHAINPKLLDGL